MQVKDKASDTATKPGSLKTAAVNLLVSDGEITKVQVLYTPDVMNKGLGLNPKVLTEWTK